MSEIDNQPDPSPEPAAGGVPPGGVSPEEKQWGMFAHLAALVGFIIPFGNFIGPLIVWQMKKADMPFVDDQGKEALNFQITVSIALVICFLLTFVLIGLLLLPVVGIAALVLTIVGALKANSGEQYRYPFAWRIVA